MNLMKKNNTWHYLDIIRMSFLELQKKLIHLQAKEHVYIMVGNTRENNILNKHYIVIVIQWCKINMK